MQTIYKLRVPAIFCALSVLVCSLISRPFVSMGLNDDAPYVVMAQTLANTGHIAYNGWATAMLGWQLYLGAAFIKLFGASFTTVRMSTLLVAIVLAFFLQRTLARAGINERNAALGTLALVLSPIYLMLSVTFMSDIFGLFAIVICLYGCIRALKATTPHATIVWLCFAVATNGICGTARQITWLGILVMVPSTLWLLRAQRRVLVTGAAVTLTGAFFIMGCMQWFKQQPYAVPEHLLVHNFSVSKLLWQFLHAFLDIPYLLLPIAALFLPQIRKCRPRVIAILSAIFLGYLFLALYPSHLRGHFLLEPTQSDWFGSYGTYEYLSMVGYPPIFLHAGVRVLLTIFLFGGLVGLIASLLGSRWMPPAVDPSTGMSWKQVGTLLGPFMIVYVLILVPRAATTGIHDRYTLGLIPGILLCVIHHYQERIQPRLPVASVVLVGIMAIYSIAVIHNTFSLYRARVALAAELRAAGVPDTSVDNGWEYNVGVELQHAPSINWPTIVKPADAYVPTPPPAAGACSMFLYDETPHIRPLYSVSFDPRLCYGPAPFAPIQYSRWPYRTPGALYVVRFTPNSKP